MKLQVKQENTDNFGIRDNQSFYFYFYCPLS